jgi:hypothetical protein
MKDFIEELYYDKPKIFFSIVIALVLLFSYFIFAQEAETKIVERVVEKERIVEVEKKSQQQHHDTINRENTESRTAIRRSSNTRSTTADNATIVRAAQAQKRVEKQSDSSYWNYQVDSTQNPYQTDTNNAEQSLLDSNELRAYATFAEDSYIESANQVSVAKTHINNNHDDYIAYENRVGTETEGLTQIYAENVEDDIGWKKLRTKKYNNSNAFESGALVSGDVSIYIASDVVAANPAGPIPGVDKQLYIDQDGDGKVEEIVTVSAAYTNSDVMLEKNGKKVRIKKDDFGRYGSDNIPVVVFK